MSKNVITYLSTLFGKEERSDASMVFYIPPQNHRPKKKIKAEGGTIPGQVGSPLPVHMMLISAGSALLEAQADRWASNNEQGKPVLKVSLSSQEEHPHALAAVNFIYTGKIAVKGAADLLQLRRQAAYLQVEGCVDACDAALLALLVTDKPYPPLSGVLDVHANRHLLPATGDDPCACTLLGGMFSTCRKLLASHSTSGSAMGEVLAWAFQDAPSVLSSRRAQRQLEKLTPAALAALLGSKTFATDDEASVLLLLATWLVANPATPAATQTWLCKLVRLAQLSEPYLTSIMPQLVVGSGWFPITREELCFVTSWASADAAKRAHMESAVAGHYDTSGAWYSTAWRPKARADAGMAHQFVITGPELMTQQALAELTTHSASVNGTFTSTGTTSVVANGFEWRARIQYRPADEAASVFLSCDRPAVLRLPNPKKLLGVASPTPCKLVVHRRRADGVEEVAHSHVFGAKHYIAFGSGLGRIAVLPLAKKAGLGAWSAYLHDGKVSGSLTWEE